jgi:hypothetical protein
MASLVFAVASLVGRGSALGQGAVPGPVPAPSSGGTGLAVPIVLALVLIGLLIAAVRIMDRRRRRRDEASAIEASLSDALMREPRLAGTVLTTSVHLPLSHRAAPTVEVRGEVAYPELRDVAIRAVRQELLRFHSDARVEDRIFVAPPIETRAG